MYFTPLDRLKLKPPVEFVCKKLDNAVEIMCSLRLSIDINSNAFVTKLQMKPSVEFVRKKLDNAVEIMCILRLSIDINLAEFILQ